MSTETVQRPAGRAVAGPPVRAVAPPPGGMQRSYPAAAAEPRAHGRWYLTTRARFWLAVLFATCWVAGSTWISLPWIRGLATHISLVPAVVVVTLVALIPGHLVAFLAAGVLFDRPRPLVAVHPTTPVTVLVAARNERLVIAETVRYLAAQDYDGPLHVLLMDNGSDDGTAAVARAEAARTGLDLTVIVETTAGKSHALNTGLAHTPTPLVITVDADTLLQKSAVRLLVARLESSPADVVAVAGHLMVRNSRAGFWARLQVWDYLLGIAAVKRVQGLFQATLVAQGAFSGYRADALRAAGGWPAAIGEDIVLTWQLLRRGRVYHEPLALGFTGVPTTLAQLTRQRSRWARGMLEGLAAVPPWMQRQWTVRGLAMVDFAIPFLDLAYVCVWLPGLVLACTGRFWVVGPTTAAVMPMTLLLYLLLFRTQKRTVFAPLGLRPRRDVVGFVLFVTIYQVFMSAMSLRGYAQHLLRRRHTWK